MFSSQNSQVSSAANYIEECFSTYLYTGNSSTQTITNGIDLAGEGGMTWIKCRNNTFYNSLYDTVRGATNVLYSNDTLAQQTYSGVTSFDSTGFTLGSTAGNNGSPYLFASWTFRKQPKFYTQGTYTGNGTGTSIGGGVLKRDISHDLGGTVGCVIIKNLDTGNWVVYHRSSAFGTENLRLNTTGAGFNASGYAPIYEVSNTTFSVIVGATGLSSSDNCNINGASYVYYIFAHNAGGFGLTGTDNVISCGSYTGGGASAVSVNLGYEAQWLLVRDTAGGNWYMFDNMRGVPTPSSSNTATLKAESSAAETQESAGIFTATGFSATSSTTINANGSTYIYIAIRKGPMKVPTDATKVFAPTLSASSSPTTFVSTGFPVDLTIGRERLPADNTSVFDRLRGAALTTQPRYLFTNTTDAEGTASTGYGVGMTTSNTGFINNWWSGSVQWNFRRAPSFFDEVCYTGNGTAGRTITHNLTVTPELIITKERSSGSYWYVYSQATGPTQYLRLEATNAAFTYSGVWNDTAPTSSVFTVGSDGYINASGQTYVAYLFATCAGVSKVGSYTGTGTTKQIDCGFTGGARFVLIKRTDSTGDWYVWDSARGIVSGNDPYLLLNSTAAEVTNTDYVDTYSAGFEISSTAPAAINASGGSFIFLAIA